MFRTALAERSSSPHGRRWSYVPYDQLGDHVGPLSREDPHELGIVLVESPSKASRRPYHRQKLATVLANQRHFALEQAERGVAVDYRVGEYHQVLASLGPLRTMRPAERELRRELAPLVKSGALTVLPHEGFLTTTAEFEASQSGPPWRMDVFYKYLRHTRGILMDGKRPRGGKLSHDAENRRRWPGRPAAPARPTFPTDPIKEEVLALVESRFAAHPGTLHPEHLAATRADVEAAWQFALAWCVPSFGPFEDAMSTESRELFHTGVSHLLNLGRLSAHRVLADVLALDLDLPSQEGFVRQLLGWREYLRHVHDATDGFRRIGAERTPRAAAAGDGGWATWSGHPWPGQGGDAGAAPSYLGAHAPLPPAFWGAESGLRCLDTVVRAVWDDAYSHHITRLMILSNLATLLDVEPRELTDWFWVAYHDAYDWVVEPNVLAMSTFGVGAAATTKPYVSGAAYIHKMSDFCDGCRFDPKVDCPVTPLYWAWLGRHEAALRGNPRVAMPLIALGKRSEAQRRADADTFARVSATLARGVSIS